mgnify:CR=1 FL=1
MRVGAFILQFVLFVSNIHFPDCFALFTNSKLLHFSGYIANAFLRDTDCFQINDFTVWTDARRG